MTTQQAKAAFPKAIKTDRKATPEFGPRMPIYAGPPLHEDDCRVQLEDGTICYVWEDSTGNEPFPVLCRELVAMDAGDNVVRRFKASERSSAGITAPVIAKTSVKLFACPADGTEIGYYET
jgi:hypothetical protein